MKRILVVDDEKHICELYKSELEDEGYMVTVANSGAEALAVFKAVPAVRGLGAGADLLADHLEPLSSHPHG